MVGHTYRLEPLPGSKRDWLIRCIVLPLAARARPAQRPTPSKGILWWVRLVPIAVTIVFLMSATNAWAGVSVDAAISGNASRAASSISTPSFSTQTGNELLLAFVATDYISGSNTTVTNVTGAGVNWTLVKRTNTQKGTAEIWRAFATTPLTNATVTATLSQSVLSLLTVVTYAGVDTSGTNGSGAIGATATGNAKKGAPSASLVTTRNGSWVFGVGNDYDNAIARTPDSGQSLVSQYLTPAGDTYWVQKQDAPTALAGTTVKIDDTAPTGDRFNLSAVEVLPSVASTGFTISGTIAPASVGSGSQIALSQGGITLAAVTADASGNFAFSNIPNGDYSVAPNKSGVVFSPLSAEATVSGANVTGVNFNATSQTWSLSGNVSPALSGVSVALTGSSTTTTTTDPLGNYTFAGLGSGTYTVTPTAAGYTFNPGAQTVMISGANISGVNFTDQAATSGSGCSGCAYVQSTRSSESGHADWPTLLNVKAGDALVYIGEFTNWTPGSTVNMTDSHGDTWYRCDNNATSDFVEIQDGTSNGMSCQYTLNIAAWPTITAQPVASQCVNTSCAQVGGAFFELALPANATARAWGTPFAGASTAGANNVSCGSITVPEPNDFLMCDFNNASGTPTAGTTPVAFTMRETVVTAIETALYSGSGTITPTGTLNPSGVPYTSITVAFGATANGAAQPLR